MCLVAHHLGYCRLLKNMNHCNHLQKHWANLMVLQTGPAECWFKFSWRSPPQGRSQGLCLPERTLHPPSNSYQGRQANVAP